MSWAQKQPRVQDFILKMKIKTRIIPNSDYETRKTRSRARHV
jgi:hypothetical protein